MKSKVKTMALSVCGGALLVFLGLFGGLYSLCVPFGLDFSPVLFWVMVLSSLLCGLLYALETSRLRLWVGLSACLFLALCVWLRWDSVFLGAQAVFHKVSLGFHQELPQILYYELPRPLTDGQLAACIDRFFLVGTPLLALWLGLWLLGRRTSLPAILTVCALPGLGLFLLREPGAVSLFALLLFLSLVALSHRGYREGSSLGGRRVLCAALPLLVVMALIRAVVPPSSYSHPVWAEDLRLRVKGAAKEWMFHSGGGDEPGVYSFPRFGSPRFDGHTVLTVRSDRPQHVLLRGWSSAVYTQYGWQGLSQEALAQLPTFAEDERPWSYPGHAVLDSGGPADGQTLQIIDIGSNTEYYYTPYFPTSMYAGATFHADSYIQRQASHYNYSFDYLDPDQVPDGATVGWDGGVYYREPDYRAFVERHYLDVPYELLGPEGVEAIRELAASVRRQTEGGYSWTSLRGQRLYTAQRVADALASFTSYDLSTPAQPLGEDFVTYFLTTSHRGYCAHYATAATLILREMGIPARFVGGYAADLPGGSEPTAIPDENAHAWVEIYVDGFGWQPVEVTPGGAFGPANDPDDPAPTASPLVSATPDESEPPESAPSPSPSPSPDAAPSDRPQSGGGETHSSFRPVLTLLLWIPALTALAGGVWLQRWLRLRRWRRQCGQTDPNAAVLALYRYLVAAERHLGRSVPPEALSLAQKAAFSQHVITAPERQTMEGFARQAHDALRHTPLVRRLWLALVWGLC